MRVSMIYLILLPFVAIIATGGCHDPAAQQATAERQAHIREVWGGFTAREADGPRRARQTLDLADRNEQRHAELFRYNVRRWQQWWRDDVHRWESGQPEYRRRIEAEFEGDEAAMQAAFRRMFY